MTGAPPECGAFACLGVVMPAALPTQDELKQELLLARARQIRARRAGDEVAVEVLGLRIDALLDRLAQR